MALKDAFAPLTRLLRQGTSPERLAFTVALGVALGVTPVLGSTTLLCAVAAIVLRLNLPAIQAANYVVYPLQLILLIPFVRIGEIILGAPRASLTAEAIVTMVRRDPLEAVDNLWAATAHALVAWSLLGGIGTAILYLAFAPIARAAAARIRRRQEADA